MIRAGARDGVADALTEDRVQALRFVAISAGGREALAGYLSAWSGQR